LIERAFEGAASWFLILGMLYLAAANLFEKRRQLASLSPLEVDRLLGHLLIISGTLLFPFCRFALWSQALIWLLILTGIALSCWGVGFFQQCKIATFFLGLSVYPKLGNISRTIWDTFFPAHALENMMASVSVSLFNLFGGSAQANGRFIIMPEGSVEVGWGCNGLDMAITMAIAIFFMGLLFKLKRGAIFGLMAAAVAVALIANIPRLILVSIAYVYWGKAWFEFWHGFWGGQIFSTILFTIFYYSVMAVVKQQNSNLIPDEAV
jgi:exosortase/archaeosortase family protein